MDPSQATSRRTNRSKLIGGFDPLTARFHLTGFRNVALSTASQPDLHHFAVHLHLHGQILGLSPFAFHAISRRDASGGASPIPRRLSCAPRERIRKMTGRGCGVPMPAEAYEPRGLHQLE